MISTAVSSAVVALSSPAVGAGFVTVRERLTHLSSVIVRRRDRHAVNTTRATLRRAVVDGAADQTVVVTVSPVPSGAHRLIAYDAIVAVRITVTVYHVVTTSPSTSHLRTQINRYRRIIHVTNRQIHRRDVRHRTVISPTV